MQVGLHSWSFRNRFKQEPSFTIFKALDLTAEMGFKSIEIMSGKANMPPGDFASDDLPYLKSVLAYAKDLGITIPCLSTYNDFAYVKDENWRLANIAYIKKWLALAGDLGVPNIRMLTGYNVEGQDRAKLEAMTVAGIRECIPFAEKHGVNMAIENHNSLFFQAEEIIKLIDDLKSPRLTTCPDPANWSKPFFTPQATPEDRERVYQGAKLLAPRATEAHLKVQGIDPAGKLLGWGDDINRLIKIFKQAGYKGAIMFESIADGDLLAPMAQARKIVEAAIAHN